MAINRSKIRRVALNLIYSVLENGGSPADVDFHLFWDIAQEKEQDQFRKTYAKAVLHAARASADSARILAERSEKLEDALHGDLTTGTLRDDAARFARRSADFETTLEALQFSLTDKRRVDSAPLAELTEEALQLAMILKTLGEELLPKLADFPVYRNVTEPYAAILRRRIRLMEAVAPLANPAHLSEDKEYAGLARQAQDLEDMRPAVEALANEVLDNRTELEATMGELLEHYSTERVDTVDRVILLIALHELKNKGLETPIVVAEATAMAHEFSGSRSARFIHGIIAAAAKA